MTRNTAALLLVAFLALACGSSEREKRTVDDERNALLNRAMITLDATPKPVREEVLKTCDKWRHIDHPCVEEEVRVDQLECWLEEGIPQLQISLTRRVGPRARNLNVLMMQNLCMEKRRWRKLERGPDF
ncbi:MAG: hypothetical protein JRS35_12695 [Deltaproteobacteria bacterium]|nr:hypothetical protein [Deltaproteobacteria bacterium]